MKRTMLHVSITDRTPRPTRRAGTSVETMKTDRATNRSRDHGASAVVVRPLVRHLDLFSGIGGFALAGRMAGGIETVGFCEIDEYCQRVLAKNFPGVPIHGDIRTLNGNEYGTVDLVTGGYPCQPFSVAGGRAGQADDRHLWPEMRRVVETARPRWIVAENVTGHISMGLDEVLVDLESIGYSWEAAIIPALAVDAQHRRDRLWIMAYANSAGLAEREKQSAREKLQTAQRGGNALDDSHGSNREQVRREAPRESGHPCEPDRGRGRLGCVQHWEAEPDVCRVADGIPDRVDRLRGLGNAIVPQVAAEILRAMLSADCMANARALAPATGCAASQQG